MNENSDNELKKNEKNNEESNNLNVINQLETPKEKQTKVSINLKKII